MNAPSLAPPSAPKAWRASQEPYRLSVEGVRRPLSAFHTPEHLRNGVPTGPGRGAEFPLRLPGECEPAALTEPTAQPRPDGALLRVVVIEDNRDAADSLRMVLELLGNDVRVAYTGPEGVQAVTQWRPDVVISDIGLPGLDGYGVARALRRHPTVAQTLLIGLSGYGSADDVARAREAGFDHYLVKPASTESLQQLLAEGRKAS